MNIYNAKVLRNEKFSYKDFEVLKLVVEQFSKINFIIFCKKTNSIIFETYGLAYFDKMLFQEFLEKESKFEPLTFEVHNEEKIFLEYKIKNGEII